MIVDAVTILKAYMLMRARIGDKLTTKLKLWKKSSKLFTDLEQFHVKDQCRVRRDRTTRSGSSITQLWRNS